MRALVSDHVRDIEPDEARLLGHDDELENERLRERIDELERDYARERKRNRTLSERVVITMKDAGSYTKFAVHLAVAGRLSSTAGV